MDIKKYIADVPDFPKKGVSFKDISPLLADPKAWAGAIDDMHDKIAKYKPDVLMGIDARGFLVAAPIAYKAGIPFGLVRKSGKLPGDTVSLTYDLEYGQDTLEVNKAVITKGMRVVICDDLLATGGTAKAAVDLVAKCGGEVVALACFIELSYLNGRKKVGNIPAEVLAIY